MGLLPALKTPGLKFAEPGTTHTGTLLEIGPEHQARTYNPVGPGKPAFWDDANTRPKMQRKFTLKTNLRDPEIEGDDGTRGLFAIVDGKPGSLYYAIDKALKGANRLGGQLTVVFSNYDPESKNPQNPRKLYDATYVEPGLGQVLNGGGTATAAAQSAPAAQASSVATMTEPASDDVPTGFTAEQWAGMPEATKAAIRAAQQ